MRNWKYINGAATVKVGNANYRYKGYLITKSDEDGEIIVYKPNGRDVAFRGTKSESIAKDWVDHHEVGNKMLKYTSKSDSKKEFLYDEETGDLEVWYDGKKVDSLKNAGEGWKKYIETHATKTGNDTLAEYAKRPPKVVGGNSKCGNTARLIGEQKFKDLRVFYYKDDTDNVYYVSDKDQGPFGKIFDNGAFKTFEEAKRYVREKISRIPAYNSLPEEADKEFFHKLAEDAKEHDEAADKEIDKVGNTKEWEVKESDVIEYINGDPNATVIQRICAKHLGTHDTSGVQALLVDEKANKWAVVKRGVNAKMKVGNDAGPNIVGEYNEEIMRLTRKAEQLRRMGQGKSAIEVEKQIEKLGKELREYTKVGNAKDKNGKELKVGDKVRVNEFGKPGKITKIIGGDVVEVYIDNSGTYSPDRIDRYYDSEVVKVGNSWVGVKQPNGKYMPVEEGFSYYFNGKKLKVVEINGMEIKLSDGSKIKGGPSGQAVEVEMKKIGNTSSFIESAKRHMGENHTKSDAEYWQYVIDKINKNDPEEKAFIDTAKKELEKTKANLSKVGNKGQWNSSKTMYAKWDDEKGRPSDEYAVITWLGEGKGGLVNIWKGHQQTGEKFGSYDKNELQRWAEQRIGNSSSDDKFAELYKSQEWQKLSDSQQKKIQLMSWLKSGKITSDEFTREARKLGNAGFDLRDPDPDGRLEAKARADAQKRLKEEEEKKKRIDGIYKDKDGNKWRVHYSFGPGVRYDNQYTIVRFDYSDIAKAKDRLPDGFVKISNSASDDKFAYVMREFDEGKLKTPDGKVVTDPAQAKAIAYSESKKTENGLARARNAMAKNKKVKNSAVRAYKHSDGRVAQIDFESDGSDADMSIYEDGSCNKELEQRNFSTIRDAEQYVTSHGFRRIM